MWWIFVLACCVCAEKQLQGARVYLGQEDISNNFPYVFGLRNKDGKPHCTCSLIARNWILTAGHCVKLNTPMYIKYKNMTFNPKETKAFLKVIKFFRHPQYLRVIVPLTTKNDLSLALIQDGPKIERFGKLSAIDYKALLGYPVQYAGFGYTGYNFSNVADEFRALQIGEAVVTKCEPEIPKFRPTICVAPKCTNKLQYVRPGDSGGPLVYKGKIIGVLTGGIPQISQFAPVSPNLGWISSVIKKYS